jgi:dihydrofolate synthase/folylpolyglutamate synthase
MAFVVFAEEPVDIAVIETGMGGRLDATNVIEPPEACVITSIGLDHTAWLGKTESAIAAEKAGIMKIGSILASGARGVAAAVIAQKARDMDVPMRQIDKDFKVDPGEIDWRSGRQQLQFSSIAGHRPAVLFGLLGGHQVDNAGLILAAIDVLIDRGWKIPDAAVHRGLIDVHWPGRFHFWPNTDKAEILFDGAHNPPAMKRFLESLTASPWKTSPKTFVFGAYQDKAYPAMLKLIEPVAKQIILCTLPGPRGLAASKALEALSRRSKCRIVADPLKALQTARETSAVRELIVVTGSLTLTGRLLQEVASDLMVPRRSAQDSAARPSNASIFTHV